MADTIDRLINKPDRKVSVGKAVQAMILNAMGFCNKALYLTPYFYRNRPVEILVGEGIQADDLNDDCLGTAIDALYDYGITELFYHVSSQALSVYKIEHHFVHPDTTSFSLHGEYNSDDETDPEGKVIHITKKYSKDNNPDLNKVVLSLMCSYRSSIPVWLEALSGNNSDKKSFSESIKAYKQQFTKKQLPYIVADSALYTKTGLSELSGVKWVSRVLEIIIEAKQVIADTMESDMESVGDGYKIKEISSNYADIKQRWLIVFSQKAYEKQYATLTKNIRKECEKMDKKLWHLCNDTFACEADAIKAARAFEKKMKYHKIEYTVDAKNKYGKKGRPNKNADAVAREFYISGSIVINSEAVGASQKTKGFFIIATNELSKKKISDEQLLSVYKAQGVSVERGFRFLKDPLFYAESLYLKSPKRIMALLMVMGLSLLIYALAERDLRNAMAGLKLTVPDQKGKSTTRPTLRWTFQFFDGILLLYIRDGTGVKRKVMNMEEQHRVVIKALGDNVEKMYFFIN